MNLKQRSLVILAFFITLCLSIRETEVQETSEHMERFETITLYRSSPHPSQLIILVSGEQGWDEEAATIARALTSLDALVVGVDFRKYTEAARGYDRECLHASWDFDALSKFVQQEAHFSSYVLPVLVGYGAGAGLVYATLAQAHPDTFRGAISLGFCPEFPVATPSLCQWEGLRWAASTQSNGLGLLPASSLPDPWIALHGERDAVCSASTIKQFARQTNRGNFVSLPEVTHSFTSPERWLPHFRWALARLTTTPAKPTLTKTLKDLPLVEVGSATPGDTPLAVILSGDGGWAKINRELGDTLIERGVPVVGLNSLKYFWAGRTPEGTAQDLERILRHYLALWKRKNILLIGYSRGADVLPFLVSRLPSDLQAQISLVALLGPAHVADFEFHLTDWFINSPSKTARPLMPEIQKLSDTKLLCVYGEEETDTLCTDLTPEQARIVPFKGGHHFGGSYGLLAETILQTMTSEQQARQ